MTNEEFIAERKRNYAALNPKTLEAAQSATLGYMKHHRQFPVGVDDWRSVDGLWKICELCEPGSVMVELGSYWGESTMFFWKSGVFYKITAIDPGTPDNGGPSSNENIIKNIIVPSNGAVALMETDSHTARYAFQDGSLDLVYIDANHAYEHVIEDIRDWLPKVKPGGIIAGHDYNMEGVSRAVTEALGAPTEVFKDTSWYVKVSP